MDLDEVDYTEDPNPHEVIWSHHHAVLGSGPFAASLWPLSTPSSALHWLGPSMPHPPPSVNIEDAPGLDYPPLSLATLNLLGTCLQPSPTFNAQLPRLPHISTPPYNHSSSSIPLLGLLSTLSLHYPVAPLILVAHLPAPLSILDASAPRSQTLNRPHPPHRWLTRVYEDVFGTIRQLADLTS